MRQTRANYRYSESITTFKMKFDCVEVTERCITLTRCYKAWLIDQLKKEDAVLL